MPIGTEIKTHYDARALDLAAPDAAETNADLIWMPQDKVRVIGFELWADVKCLNELDSGFVLFAAELSKVGQWFQDGTLGYIATKLEGRSVTVAAGVTEVEVGGGNVRRQLLFMFPDGKGVDLDEGEPLYFNTVWQNSMANPQRVGGGFIIYYVER